MLRTNVLAVGNLSRLRYMPIHMPIHEHPRQRLQETFFRNIVSTLFLSESHYEIELLQQELLDFFDREEDRQAASLSC